MSNSQENKTSILCRYPTGITMPASGNEPNARHTQIYMDLANYDGRIKRKLKRKLQVTLSGCQDPI